MSGSDDLCDANDLACELTAAKGIGADCDVVSQLNIADMMTHTYPLLPASGYPPNDDLKNESMVQPKSARTARRWAQALLATR